MQFFLLGPFEVRVGETRVPVTSRRQKALLAFLLLHANEAVSRDRLVEELWDGGAPPTAENALHGLVSQTRRLLEIDGSPVTIVTRAPGYAIEIDAAATDVSEFERLIESGTAMLTEGNHDAAARALRDALSLWRGAPLEDLGDLSFVRAERSRLEELRLQALESRIDADLALGRAKELVPELQSLVANEPYREHFRGQLMLALYRSGRQADALTAFRNARRLFVEELGIEPSAELQALERTILRQDPSLFPTTQGRPPAARRFRPRLIAATALLVVVGAAVAALALRGGSSAKRPVAVSVDSVAVIDPRTNAIVAAIPVGSTPIAVAVGEHGVWVVNSDDGTLTRIDPQTRRVVRTIGLGTPANDATVAFGSVWVADGAAGSLTRVDPRTNAIAQTFRQRDEAPLISPAALAVTTGAGSLWLASGTRRVLRIDPASGKTLATVQVPVGPLAVAAGGGAVWVGSLAHRVARIATRTDKSTASIPVPDEVEGIAVGQGSVWAAVCCDAVWRIDPTTNVLTSSVQVGAVPSGVAIGSGSVWVSSYGDGTVSRINPYTGRVTASIRVGHGAVDVAVGYGFVWVTVERRTVS